MLTEKGLMLNFEGIPMAIPGWAENFDFVFLLMFGTDGGWVVFLIDF